MDDGVASTTSTQDDGQWTVVAATTSTQEDIPLESCTLKPEFIGWKCDMCSEKIVQPDMKIIHYQKIHCHECFNKMLKEMGQQPLSKRQFQRKAKLQYAAVRTGLPEEILKLTERGAQFKRSAEEVETAMRKLTQAQLIQAQAATDYLALIGEGIAGLYICRDDRSIEAKQLLRIVSQNGCVRAVGHKETIRCCDVIPQMNHWFRDTGNHFRCAAGGHMYQPWGGTKEKPGYILCLYSDDGVKYIRAEVPMAEVETKLALLKIMMAEDNILAIIHDRTSFTDFWRHIDNVCDVQFCIVEKHCDKVYLRVPEPGFTVVETQTSLKMRAIGHELKMLYVNPTDLHPGVFTQQDWKNLLGGLFAHFVYDQVAESSLKAMSKNERKMLRGMTKTGEVMEYTAGEVMDLMANRVRLTAGEDTVPHPASSSSTP